MENGTVNLDIFVMLDAIRDKYEISAIDWAKASWGKANKQSRISELRAKVRTGEPGRAFTPAKCIALLNGLKKLLGGEIVSKELRKLLEKAGTKKEQMLLLVMAMEDQDENHSLMYLKSVVLKNSKA